MKKDFDTLLVSLPAGCRLTIERINDPDNLFNVSAHSSSGKFLGSCAAKSSKAAMSELFYIVAAVVGGGALRDEGFSI